MPSPNALTNLRSLRICFATYLIACLLLFVPSLAHAQLTLTFDTPIQVDYPGSTLTFTGTLTNSGTSLVFINGDSFSLNGTALTLDDSPFFLDGPLSLEVGQVFAGPIFQVLIDPTAPAQIASGSFLVRGGATDTAQDTVASANFSVTVSAAPEPASGLLVLGTALIAVAVNRRRMSR